MRTINVFRSMLSLIATVAFLLGMSASESKAQCPTINLAPGASPCCYEIRMTNNTANTWLDLVIQGNAGSLVGVARAPISNPPIANIPNTKYTFTPSGVMYWASPIANVTIGSFCVTGNTPITITIHGANGQVCMYNFQTMCNNPIGGGGIGNPPVGGGGNPFGGGDVFPVLKKEGNMGEGEAAVQLSSIVVAPNPASTQAMVRFSSPQALSNVVLSINDITGREVLRVLDGAALSAGSYDLPVNAAELNSGIYQVSLRSEGMLLFNTTLSVLR